MKKYFNTIFFALAILSSCKKDDSGMFDNAVKGHLSVEFDNIVGAYDLQLNTGIYTNNAGESYKISKLKYYVSNFVFTRVDGSTYTVPQDSSYFLIDESTGTDEAVLQVPEGEYKAVQFILGIDSLRNTKDISQRTGVLDPTGTGADMYWSWNSGYIFFKMEGTSPQSTAAGNMFMYHIGGFGGYNAPTINNIKTISLDLTARGTPKVKSGKSTNIHLMVDVAKVFSGANNFSIATYPSVMFTDFSTSIANNLTTMFKHDHTEN